MYQTKILLGDFSTKGEAVFSTQQLGIMVYMKLVMITRLK
jgi:hypothetical protein